MHHVWQPRPPCWRGYMNELWDYLGGKVVSLSPDLIMLVKPSWTSRPTKSQVEHYQVTPVQFSSVSRVWLFATPWTAGRQAFLSITNSRSILKLMSFELVMPSNHLILSRALLLLFPILASIRVFFKESVLRIGWWKYWSFSFNISPSDEYSGLTTFRIDWLDPCSPRDSQVFSNTTVWKHQFFSTQLSL